MGNISLTTAAIEKFQSLLKEPNSFIRIGVSGGACKGYSYVIRIEDKSNPNKDIEFNFNGIRVVVDNRSINYLNDCIIDWKKDLMGEEFVFNNPNADSKCGCGKSFSIKGV